MRLPLELVLIVMGALASPLVPRSASFAQLAGLTSNSRDVSTTDNRFPEKYFHESVYHPHYDGRFAALIQPRQARLFHMRLLLRSYMAAMNRAGVRTWLMHGSLLGWWWNQGMFPWDSDLDFCVEETGMAELGWWWNMTVHDFTAEELGLEDTSNPDTFLWDRRKEGTDKFEGDMRRIQEPSGLKAGVWNQVLKEGKKYLLEVNPHYTDISTSDAHNKIDARWIDTSTGLFIDITTVHAVPSSSAKSEEKHQIVIEQGEDTQTTAEEKDRPEEMYTKDTHLYTTSSLFPLRQSRFEGTLVFVPYAYEQLLIEEYGPRALTETWFNKYQFDQETKNWAPAPEPEPSDKVKGSNGDKSAAEHDGQKVKWKSMSDEERSRKDNQEEKMHAPSPGRVGDVHVVPPR